MIYEPECSLSVKEVYDYVQRHGRRPPGLPADMRHALGTKTRQEGWFDALEEYAVDTPDMPVIEALYDMDEVARDLERDS